MPRPRTSRRPRGEAGTPGLSETEFPVLFPFVFPVRRFLKKSVHGTHTGRPDSATGAGPGGHGSDLGRWPNQELNREPNREVNREPRAYDERRSGVTGCPPVETVPITAELPLLDGVLGTLTASQESALREALLATGKRLDAVAARLNG